MTHTQRDQQAIARGKQARERGAQRLWLAIEARRRFGPSPTLVREAKPMVPPDHADQVLRGA